MRYQMFGSIKKYAKWNLAWDYVKNNRHFVFAVSHHQYIFPQIILFIFFWFKNNFYCSLLIIRSYFTSVVISYLVTVIISTIIYWKWCLGPLLTHLNHSVCRILCWCWKKKNQKADEPQIAYLNSYTKSMVDLLASCNYWWTLSSRKS